MLFKTPTPTSSRKPEEKMLGNSKNVQEFKSFRCKYGNTLVTSFAPDGSIFTKKTDDELEFIFSSLNLEKQTGRKIYKNHDVKVIPMRNGDTILILELNENGHADLAFACMHALYMEPVDFKFVREPLISF